MNSVLERLFAQAVELTADEREQFLTQHCGDPDIRRELDALLAHDQGAETFLQKAVSEEASSALKTLVFAPGHRIGPYRVLSVIGRGGMGLVYLGERVDGKFEQRVAIKVLQSGFALPNVGNQIQRECRILASLDHPNIARVLDAGVSQDELPYFAMEYIEGQAIDRYCERRQLSLQNRVRLLLPLCDALQLAHQKLIVHRDLKPDNILVTEQGIPKLLDFGIAKVLDEVPGSAQNTATRVLTPEYASPEQVRGEPVTTATDIYSLGGVLYRLLTGCTPHKTQGKSPLEMAQAICEEEVRKPSELRLELAGDIDSILVKVLQTDPLHRYRSIDEFAADLERWLEGKPVMAVAPSWAYRARKFVRRHRVALVTASAFALVLVVAAIVSIRQGIRANREAAVAEAVNDFLQSDLLAQASPYAQARASANPDLDLKVRTALDRAAQRVEGKFTNQPEVEAAIRDTIGWTYMDLGLLPEARRQLERALELRRRVLGAEDAKTLSSMSRLGWVVRLQGRYAEAEALVGQALEAQRRVLGPANPNTLVTEGNLAIVYLDEGKFAQAERLHSEIFGNQKRILGPEHPDTLTSETELADDYDDEGNYAQAEPLFTECLEIQKRVLGPEHPDTLQSMANLGILYSEEGKNLQAEALLPHAFEVLMRVLGPENRVTQTSMSGMAWLYGNEGKYAQAEALYKQLLEIQKREFGPDHRDTAETLVNMAALAAQRGNKEGAIRLLDQSVDHLSPREALDIEKDPDFVPLHGDPRFAALVAHAKQVAEAQQKAPATQASH